MPALFLLLDAAMKLVKPGFVVEATGDLGFPESAIVPLGIVFAGCTILYLIPRTGALGAILLTGYLGGAIATHVRHEDGWFPTVFCAVFGALGQPIGSRKRTELTSTPSTGFRARKAGAVPGRRGACLALRTPPAAGAP